MNQEEEKVARVYNFSAGPAVLPEEVLREAADEMLDYQGSGQSVMEMSHRSKVYDNIIKEAEKDLRELMNIPDNYKVLFLQGGASQFFAEVPMNLMKNKKAAHLPNPRTISLQRTIQPVLTAKKMQHLQTQKNLPMILIMCIKMELMKDPEQDMAVRSPYR